MLTVLVWRDGEDGVLSWQRGDSDRSAEMVVIVMMTVVVMVLVLLSDNVLD